MRAHADRPAPRHDDGVLTPARRGATPVDVPGPSVGVVVPAGGSARRFGTDKLVADLDGRPLLVVTVAGVRAQMPAAPVVVVGPAGRGPLLRRHDVDARTVREEPAGAGPAAAVLAGTRALLAEYPALAVVAVVPGDAPWAGSALPDLLAAVAAGASAAVAVAPDGRRQHLLLAVRTAHLAGLSPTVLVDAPARSLLRDVPADHVVEVPVDARAAFDVDDRAALALAASRAHPTPGELEAHDGATAADGPG